MGNIMQMTLGGLKTLDIVLHLSVLSGIPSLPETAPQIQPPLLRVPVPMKPLLYGFI